MNVLSLLLLLTATTAAPTPQGAGLVRGVVTDSLHGRPLAGATVQLAPASTDSAPSARVWTAHTDSLGQYALTGVPPGRYLAGFFHPLLDSLGFGTAPRTVEIGPGRAQIDFGIPSAATIVAAVCPGREPGDSSALLVGHVRRAATSEPVPGATVAAAWTELVQEAVLVKPHPREAFAPVSPEGWFAVCGIAPETPVLVRAAAGDDSSGYVRLTLPPRAVAHQPLFAGSATSGRLLRATGTVRDAEGRPIPDAQAHVWGTERTAQSANNGRFVLDSVPAGTQTVEVRAIGFVPVQLVVHLTGDDQPLNVLLAERVTTLPTATIEARPSTSLRLAEFYQRQADVEKGINRGYFITPEELERRKPPLISGVFDDVPGVMVDRQIAGNNLNRLGAVVRGPHRIDALGTRCIMTVYLDGIRIVEGGRSVTDFLDERVVPSQIAAIEVYPHPVSAPPQYQSLNGTCGIILLWTK